jgi:hypothetical protein
MLPKIDDIDIDPQTFEYTGSRISLDLCLLLRKKALACLPSVHPLHTPYLSMLNSGRPITISLIIGNAL